SPAHGFEQSRCASPSVGSGPARAAVARRCRTGADPSDLCAGGVRGGRGRCGDRSSHPGPVLHDRREEGEFLAVAEGSDVVAGVVGWTDLTAPGVSAALATLCEGPGGDRLVGIRHLVQGEADPRWLCRDDVRRGLTAVAEAGLCYDILTFPHQLPAAIETARALPQLTFVLDHLSKPPIAAGALEPWATALRELAAEPNVFCKLS